MEQEPKWGRRTPKDFTAEMREESMEQLNDTTRPLIDFIHACVLLDISLPFAYALARQEKIPGAVQLGNSWKIKREVLHKFLYGEQ